jgi:transcriptional regulator with XRE-family HTH domain
MAKAKSGRGHGRGIGPIDAHVGARLRQRRTLLGITQTRLGEAVGVTFQQVQKYENGTNQNSASQLFGLSRVLNVPVEYFFNDMPAPVAVSSPAQGGDKAKKPPRYEPDPMAKRETMELVRAYFKIEDANIRDGLREWTEILGAATSKDR